LFAALFACVLSVHGAASVAQTARQEQPNASRQAPGGMANAGPQKADFDTLHRPITAGGFVKSGPIIFQDVAASAGLAHWRHTAGTPEKRLILEEKGPGVCLLDYDNDGWLDIYLVNGSTYDALAGKAAAPPSATSSMTARSASSLITWTAFPRCCAT
jgi:hypothetical protein